MRLRNFWLQKAQERSLLKIVHWAQKHNKKVEHMNKDEVREAIKTLR